MRSTIRTTAIAATLAVLPVAATAQQPSVQDMARGAQLYGQVCARCHNPRPATERTDREWVTIMQHMRARANLTKADAGAILVFLRSTNRDGRRAAIETADPILYAAVDRYVARLRASAGEP